MTDASNPTFACPKCGKRRMWKPEYAARRVKCSCGVVFVAPASAEGQGVEDEYDIAPDATAAAPVRAAPVAPQSAAPVVAYRSAPAKAAGTVARPGRVELDDPWQGDKFRNLYVPAGLIIGASLFNIIVRAWFLKDASEGLRVASMQMGLSLLVELPVMLLACVAAVKLLDAAFGPLGPAILKLSSIALAPDAVQLLVVLIGIWIGGGVGVSGMLGGALIGLLIGWVLSLILYFWLFTYYFDMTLGEASRLVILIWLIRIIGVAIVREALRGIL